MQASTLLATAFSMTLAASALAHTGQDKATPDQTPLPNQAASSIPSPDLNGDGPVDVQDLIVLLLSWGTCDENVFPCRGDLTFDGFVDADDLAVLIQHWSE